MNPLRKQIMMAMVAMASVGGLGAVAAVSINENIASSQINAVESQTYTWIAGDWATANEWVDATKYATVSTSPFTFSVTGAGNDGKYYNSDKTWRFYSGSTLAITSEPNIKITAATYTVGSADTAFSEVSYRSWNFSFTATTKIKKITITYQTIAEKEVTYKITSKTEVATSGEAPSGSSATYSQTYTSVVSQMTNGNSTTLTVSGCAGYIVGKVALSMHSNAKGGSGTMSITAGETTLAEITSATSFKNIYGTRDFTTTYVPIQVNLTNAGYVIGDEENLTILITATANSLFIESYTITFYDPNESSSYSIETDKEALDINLNDSDMVTVTPTGFTLDHLDTVIVDSTVVSTDIADEIVEVTGLKAGTTTVTIRAYTAGKASPVALKTITVTVESPTLKSANQNVYMNSDGTEKRILLTVEHFSDSLESINFVAAPRDENICSAEVVTENDNKYLYILSDKAGKTTIDITATGTTYSQSATASIGVTVYAPSVSISEATLTLGVGETVDLTAGYNYFNSAPTLTITSSNENVAEAIIDGTDIVVEGIGAGSATLTLKGVSGNQSAETVCYVTVSDGGAKILTAEVGTPENVIPGKIRTWNDSNVLITHEKAQGTTDIYASDSDTSLRFYAKHTLEVLPLGGAEMSVIVFEFETTGNAFTFTNFVTIDDENIGDYTINGTKVLFIPLDGTQPIAFSFKQSTRLVDVTVAYAAENEYAESMMWGTRFNKALPVACINSFNGDVTTDELLAAWSFFATKWNALSESDKAVVKGYQASTVGDDLAQAMAKYEYIVTKYGSEAFATSGGNYLDRPVLNSTTNNISHLIEGDNAEIIIAVSCLVMAGSTLTFFLLRKKKRA